MSPSDLPKLWTASLNISKFWFSKSYFSVENWSNFDLKVPYFLKMCPTFHAFLSKRIFNLVHINEKKRLFLFCCSMDILGSMSCPFIPQKCFRTILNRKDILVNKDLFVAPFLVTTRPAIILVDIILCLNGWTMLHSGPDLR